MRLPLSLLAAALLSGAVVPSAGRAAVPQGPRFTLEPLDYDPALIATKSYFILQSKPATTVADRVRIVNTGGATGTALLYGVDATTGKTSGAVYLPRAAPRRDVGSWISIAKAKVTLAPGEDVIVPFTLHVPRSARPGDHLGAIVAENAQLQKSSGRGALRIKQLTITAVELQLPGAAVGRVVATGVQAGGARGYQYVHLHLANTGTVLIKAAATLTVRNDAGRVVARRSIQLGTFVPGTAIDYPALPTEKALRAGKYTAEVRLRSSDERIPSYRKPEPPRFDETRTFPFTVASAERTKGFSGAEPLASAEDTAKPADSQSSRRSLGVVVIALIVVAVAVLLLMLLRRFRKRRANRPAALSPVPSPVESAAVASPAADEEELPGWAGLLAAYGSKSRSGENGLRAEDETDELVPVMTAVAPEATALEPDIQFEPPFGNRPEPWSEPPLEVEAHEPEAEPRIAGPAGPDARELDAEELKELILKHDRAVAEARLRAQEPRPAPAHQQAASAALVDASLLTAQDGQLQRVESHAIG